MLNKNEKRVMSVIYEKCLHAGGSCLITTEELIELLPKGKPIKKEEAESLIRSLELDDYFDVIFSDRGGEPIMCINLHSKGQLFKRETVMFRRAVVNRLTLAGISAVVTFIIGRILVAIFT